jgi:hypothetical protein
MKGRFLKIFNFKNFVFKIYPFNMLICSPIVVNNNSIIWSPSINVINFLLPPLTLIAIHIISRRFIHSLPALIDISFFRSLSSLSSHWHSKKTTASLREQQQKNQFNHLLQSIINLGCVFLSAFAHPIQFISLVLFFLLYIYYLPSSSEKNK